MIHVIWEFRVKPPQHVADYQID